MKHVCDYALSQKVTHLTKAFDGIIIDSDRVFMEPVLEGGPRSEGFALGRSRYIAEQPLGLVVVLREKAHLPFYGVA